MNFGLLWLDTLLGSTRSERRSMKAALLEGIRQYGAKWKKTDKPQPKDPDFPDLVDPDKVATELDPDAVALYKDLKSEKEWEFIGFAPNTMYVKESGSQAELESIWVHPYAVPALVYKHRRLPLMIYTSPTIEFNTSVLREVDANRHNGLISKGRGIMG